jgi:Cu(I)/Ag(I) efflux system membrane fusion protein
VFLLTFVWLLHSCKGDINSPEQKNGEIRVFDQSNLPENGTADIRNLLNAYFDLKNSMVEGEEESIRVATKKLALVTSETEDNLLTNTVNSTRLKPIFDTLRAANLDILNIKDPTAEKQRVAFVQVSNTIYLLVEAVQYRSNSLYRQYCPMAMNDEGAYWLSDIPVIQNPYFGKKMLECGETTDTLK